MKVLGVLEELRPSGAEVNLKAAANEWRVHGVEMELLATASIVGPFAQTLGHDYAVSHIPLTPFPRFASRYLRLLDANRYDVVHVHAEQGNIATASLPRFRGVPVVRTCHNLRSDFTGALRMERVAQRAALRRLGVQSIAVSHSVARSEWERFRNATTVIYNAFDTARFQPSTEPQRSAAKDRFGLSKQFTVVSVGNCSPVKNHTALLKAVSLLQHDLDLVYLHAGMEDPERSERRLARSLSIQDRVQFLGNVKDVRNVLHAADCYVMPSLYEGMPIAALEALGCGVPTVVTAVPGLLDVAQRVESVRLTDDHPTSIAASILGVAAATPEERERIRTDSAAAAHRTFSVEAYVARHVALYQDLVRGDRRRVRLAGPRR